MASLWKKFWNDDAGVVVSAEIVLILTIAVLGVIVGLAEFRAAIVAEYGDLSAAFSHLNQSYGYAGLHGCWNPCAGGWRSWVAGSSFVDVYEGTGTGLIGDIGCIGGPVFAGGFTRGGCSSCAKFGTIVLSDGTLISIRMVSPGTWELPGGLLLAEFSSHRGYLSLSDGTSIPFLYGLCGLVESDDGKVLSARPGTHGTIVLSDGHIATWSTHEIGYVVLEDETELAFHAAAWDHVILPDGTSMAVRSAEADTLVLSDGRELKLIDAVLPPGFEQPILDEEYSAIVPGFVGPGCCDGSAIAPLPPLPHPAAVAPLLPCCPTPPTAEAAEKSGCNGPCKSNGRLPIEIPAGPIPQRLPQG